MSMITKEWTFDMAHRLIRGYPGKCAHLHGHSYKVEVALKAKKLDRYGMVADFDMVKDRMKEWVDRYLDHGTIVAQDDTDLLRFLENNKQKHFVLRDVNATAECIARALLAAFREEVSEYLNERPDACPDLNVSWVRLWETATSSAVVGD